MGLRPIALTGSTGYLGTSLIQDLENMENPLYCVPRNLQKIPELTAWLDNYKIHTVVNLAAISDVAKCEQNPELATEVNLNFTKNLLKASSLAKSTKFIQASTVAVYGEKSKATVNDHPAPIGVYAKTKLEAENYIKENSEGLQYYILRFSNIIGLSAHKLKGITKYLLESSNQNQQIILPVLKDTSQTPVRDFLDIRDAKSAILNLIKTETTKSQTLNISTGKETSLKELANLFNIEDKFITFVEKESKDIAPLYCTANPTNSIELWHPEIDLKETVKHIINNFAAK